MDVSEIMDQLDQQREGLSDEFEYFLDVAFDLVCSNPFIYREIAPTLRKSRMYRFNYAIYFEVVNDEVHVLAVIHNASSEERIERKLGQARR
jgi:plasmid stabilization system protein ParE